MDAGWRGTWDAGSSYSNRAARPWKGIAMTKMGIRTSLAVGALMSAFALVPSGAGAAGANDLSALCSEHNDFGLTHGACVAGIRSQGGGTGGARTSADLSSACRDQGLSANFN